MALAPVEVAVSLSDDDKQAALFDSDNDLLVRRWAGDIIFYGADPTGIISSASAIQEALDTEGVARIPSGTFSVDKTINLDAHKFVHMDVNAVIKPSGDFNVFEVSEHAATLQGGVIDCREAEASTGYTSSVIFIKGVPLGSPSGTQLGPTRIQDIHIFGPDVNFTGKGIYVRVDYDNFNEYAVHMLMMNNLSIRGFEIAIDLEVVEATTPTPPQDRPHIAGCFFNTIFIGRATRALRMRVGSTTIGRIHGNKFVNFTTQTRPGASAQIYLANDIRENTFSEWYLFDWNTPVLGPCVLLNAGVTRNVINTNLDWPQDFDTSEGVTGGWRFNNKFVSDEAAFRVNRYPGPLQINGPIETLGSPQGTALFRGTTTIQNENEFPVDDSILNIFSVDNNRNSIINVVSNEGNAHIRANVFGASQFAALIIQRDGVTRWAIGNSAGVQNNILAIHRYDNTGVRIDTPINIFDDTGLIQFQNGVIVSDGDVNLTPTNGILRNPIKFNSYQVNTSLTEEADGYRRVRGFEPSGADITFTLPDLTATTSGLWFYIYNTAEAGQGNVIIAGVSSQQIRIFDGSGGVSADSISLAPGAWIMLFNNIDQWDAMASVGVTEVP